MTAAERSARYRLRKRLSDSALLSGIQPIEAALVGRKPDGTWVIVDYDEIATLLNPIEGTTRPVNTTTKRLYSPRGINREAYDAWVHLDHLPDWSE